MSKVEDHQQFTKKKKRNNSFRVFLNFLFEHRNSLTGRLTWLVYIIGSVIGGRVSYSTIDEYDALDGELVCR